MLARKRGGLRGEKSRKMAKKNAPTALQTDVTTDEEWEKILERKGLVLADIYSEWSGPCTGMVSILKKIKMEIGGDSLSYATARCDRIESLARFRGKSEPTWMFIRNGQMVNVIFGANCPQLVDHLTRELKRVQNNEPPEFWMDVSEMSPQELERMKKIEAAIAARDAEKNARKAAEEKAKYEAELEHYMTSLVKETFVILFPWIFKDDEGNKKEKKNCPAYVELVEQLLPENFSIEQEIKKQFDDEILEEMQKECDFILSEETREFMTEGQCLCIRLKSRDPNINIEEILINTIYDEPYVPQSPTDIVEGCYAYKHMPPRKEDLKESSSAGTMGTAGTDSTIDDLLTVTTVWVPLNARNRAITFRVIFAKYVDATYPYEGAADNIPIVLFKYDSTRRKELRMVVETYSNEVVNFGVFERDRLPDLKLIATSIEEFEEEIKEKTSYEVFVCVIRKVSNEAFLSFAGIGPYHVSESPESAVDESMVYFPRKSTVIEEILSDEEEKVAEEVAAV